VLRELAQKDRVILGFDIVTLEATANGWAPCIIGESTYDMGLEISTGSWNESVAHSLQLALRDLERAAEADSSPNVDDGTWYAIVTSDQESSDELRRAYPQNTDGSFELRFPRRT
jgi:hypothetical protein